MRWPVKRPAAAFIERIALSAQSISNLITDLMDLSRVEASSTETAHEVVSMPLIVQYALAAVEGQIHAKQHCLLTNLAPHVPCVQGNGQRLKQMVRNLLHNAILYTPERGTISIALCSDADMVVLLVQDNGIGIPIEAPSRVFDKFYRAENVRETYEGAGLGLAIVKSIVERHDGRIWVQSRLGAGTTFTVILPAAPNRGVLPVLPFYQRLINPSPVGENMTNHTLTAVPGIRVGHFTHLEGGTGCTVVLCPEGTVGGIEQRGGAPGTRETDLLRTSHWVETVNAVVLAGGSAFGLAAADGVVRWLEERQIGYRSGLGFLVPIVPAAILMDLAVGSPNIRPDPVMGYAACEAATADPVAQGTVGAGTGCRVGAMYGNARASKGGIGSASISIDGELIVAALMAVNAVGDVLDEQGSILAGLRQSATSHQFVGMLNALCERARDVRPSIGRDNTVIGVVATNARFNKEQVNKVAQMADDGLSRAVNPAHTMFDGDTIFALATGQIPANVNTVGAYAAEVTAQAVRNAVRAATSLHDVRAISG